MNEVDGPLTGTVEVSAPPMPTVIDPKPASVLVVPFPGPRGRPGTAGAGIVYTQTLAQSVWTIEHQLNRAGPVSVVVVSLDYETTWENVLVQRVSADVVRLMFDDPTSGHALIL